jgi:hypothetical protein
MSLLVMILMFSVLPFPILAVMEVADRIRATSQRRPAAGEGVSLR